MRLESGESHGVIRSISTTEGNAEIVEGTMKNGKLHGLTRRIGIREVSIELHKSGELLASF